MSAMIGPCPRPEDLACWLEGGLSPAERRPVTAHLAACDDCRRAVGLASLVETPPARALDEVLLARVVTASRHRPVWMWAAAGGILVALVLGLLFSRPRPQPPVGAQAPPSPETVVVRPDPLPEPPAPVPPKPELPPQPELVIQPQPPKPVPAPEPPRDLAKPDANPEAPKPEPEKPKVEVVQAPPGPTTTDLEAVFGPVFAVDPSGDVWLRRGTSSGAKLGPFEQAGFLDTFSSREGGGFTLDARLSVALEKGAEAGLSWFKPDQAYTLHAGQGLVMIDTEGAAATIRVTRGGSTVTFSDLSGCLAVEPRGDQVAATLLRGRSDVRFGAETRKAEVGREVVMAADGKATVQAGETKKKLDRLAALRPRTSTIFAASFDEKKDQVNPFPYTVLVGRVAEGGGGFFLEGLHARPPAGGKVEVTAALRPDRPISVTSDMVLRFRYRTTLPSFSVRLGAYSAAYVSRARPGQWAEGEIRRDAFTHEGVELVPSTEVAEVYFTGVVQRSIGAIEIDAVQFLRRAR